MFGQTAHFFRNSGLICDCHFADGIDILDPQSLKNCSRAGLSNETVE